jgi:hypothetical protein
MLSPFALLRTVLSEAKELRVNSAKHLLLRIENKQKADPSCRLQQGLQVEIGTSLRSG